MFYTLINRYLTQQWQQLQTLQAQQDQFLAWQYQQLQAWQSLIVNATLANQRFLLSYHPFLKIGFVPFNMPLMQYAVRVQATPAVQPVTLKDVTPTPPAPAVTPSTTAVFQLTYDSQDQPSTQTTQTLDATQTESTKITTTPKTTAPKTAAPEPRVPTELIHEPPQSNDISPSQAAIPQPFQEKPDAMTTVSPAKTPATRPGIKKIATQTTNPPTQTNATKTSNKNSTAKRTTSKTPTKIAKVAKYAIHQRQVEHSELPNITPISAIEQALYPVDSIDLNTATVAELVRLDGITSRRAQDIIAYRDTVAPFASVDELVNIKGIGQSTVNKNRHLIKIGNTTDHDSELFKPS